MHVLFIMEKHWEEPKYPPEENESMNCRVFTQQDLEAAGCMPGPELLVFT